MLAAMRTLALALLAATACEEPQPVLELGSGRCDEVVLAAREEALHYWDVRALAMERVGGDRGWAIGRDPGNRVMLQAWPEGPGFDLSKLGPVQAFRLLPGLHPGQTWMTLDRGDKLRVWRLGSAAEGAGVEAPDLAGFPGPAGEWRRRLLIVDGVPYLLAAPAIEFEEHITLYVAALDPETLALGTIWPIEFTRPCLELYGPDPAWCASEQNAWVDILDVAEAGSVAGGVALLGIRQSGADGQYAVLELHHQDGPAGPIAIRRDGFFIPGSSYGSFGAGLTGQLAADADNLYVFIHVIASDDWWRLNYMPLRGDPAYGQASPETAYPLWTGPLVQLGTRAVLGDFARGRWTLAPVRGGVVELDVRASITVEAEARISSAGREQLLVMPPSGHAQRVVAGCAADE